MSRPAAPDEAAFRLLTENHTLLVLDTETTPAVDRGPQRLIQLGTVPVTDGRRGRPTVRLVDPTEPITNSHVHGLTDADVTGKPVFAGLVQAVDALLTGAPHSPPVVLVGHYLSYDVHVLRGEYERLGRLLPEVPTLDTIALTRYVGHDTGRSRSLLALARSLEIEFVPEHDAGKDAVATARCLVALLRKAAAAGLVELEDILDAVGSTTLDLTPPELPTRRDEVVAPDLPAEHLATHTRLLSADPAPEEVNQWLAGAVECARLCCPLARDRVIAALDNAPDHAARLLEVLARPDGLASLEEGQAGTHAGALAELIPAALSAKNAGIRWWRTRRQALAGLPRCHRTGTGPRCPDCLAGNPCPLDTLHQAIAAAECAFAADGHMEVRNLARIVSEPGRGAHAWARTEPDVAGHAFWLVHDYLISQGADSRASSVLDHAVGLGLDLVEPRLALLHAQALLNRGQTSEVDAVLKTYQRPPGNTDDGWDQLHDWAVGPYAEALARAKPVPARIRTLPRQSRPEGRVRANRLKH